VDVFTCSPLGLKNLSFRSWVRDQRQSREFAAAVKAAGKPVEMIVGENYNHFELIETLASPYGILGSAALRMMNLV
jgi:arylformamidase